MFCALPVKVYFYFVFSSGLLTYGWDFRQKGARNYYTSRASLVMWLQRTRIVECCEYYAALVTNIIAISIVADCIQYYPDSYVECCPREIEGSQLENCTFHLHAVKSVRRSLYHTVHHAPRLQYIQYLSRSAVDSLSYANTSTSVAMMRNIDHI